jgi:DNA (cytosine-5)-methyltransferase 1
MSTLLDVEATARRLNLSEQQVRNLCRSGKLPAEQVGKSWILRDDDIEDYYDSSSCGVAEDQPAYVAAPQEGFKTLSFFSGAMGLDTGLQKEGFNVLLASEIDNACRKTIKKNKPNIALIGDIEAYSPAQIKLMAGLGTDEEIDLIIGGPPCQAFSTAGRRKGFQDRRGNVFLTYLDIIKSLRPKFAVIENVRGLLSAPLKHRPHSERGLDFPGLEGAENPGGALKLIISILEEAGYGVTFNLYNTANFGTAQKRERVVMVCSRDGGKAPYLVPTHSEDGSFGLPRWRTLRDVVSPDTEPGQHYISFPEKRLRFYRLLKAGENWRNLPPDLQKEAMGAAYYSGGGKTGFLRRLSWDEPSPTLVTHPAMPATDLAHPVLDRPLSVEEYRKIQEFPDDWKIEGTILEQYRQIGNAVPHGLGRAIGRLVRALLNKENIPVHEGFKYSRYRHTSDKDWQEG